MSRAHKAVANVAGRRSLMGSWANKEQVCTNT